MNANKTKIFLQLNRCFIFFFSLPLLSPPSPPAPVFVKYSHIGCRRQFNGIIWSHLPNYNCFRPNISVMHIQEIKTEYKKQWTRRTLASCLPVTNLLFKPSIWVEKFYLNQLLNQTQHRFCWNVLYLPHVPGLLVGTTIRIMLIYFKCPCILLSCYFLTMSLFCFLEKKFWVETFFFTWRWYRLWSFYLFTHFHLKLIFYGK